MKGIGASPGYAVGKVLIKKEFVEPQLETITDVSKELELFNSALSKADEQINKLIVITTEKIGEAEGQIFQAHLMMLNDPELLGQIKNAIEKDKVAAAYATLVTRNSLVAIFESMDNEYMRERSADVKDVCNRIIKILLNVEDLNYDMIDEPVILVAHDLTPSDTARISKDKVVGFITEIGGETSHTAIMSRTLEIPAVVGADQVLSELKENDIVAFNGSTGEIIFNPSESVISDFKEKSLQAKEEREALNAYIGKKSISVDGHHVELGCNIGKPGDVEYVNENDGEGVGLFRSEFLYMDRDNMPSEEEQYEAYKSVLVQMGDRPVVIRTLDVGGDKHLSYLDFPKEDNPFLGFRAIRFCLENQDIFKIQLRALVRASVHGNLKIMFPMISNVREIREAKRLIQEIKEELAENNIEYAEFEVGIMIEIPAAAIISDSLAKEVDFFSIGTNDLIQYTTAVDRMNQKIADLYSPYHPALLRLIKTVIDNGHKEGIWVGMCGEVAGNQKLIPLLLGMGLDEFSMSASSVLRSRKLISTLNKKELEGKVSEVIDCADSYEVLEKLDQLFTTPNVE